MTKDSIFPLKQLDLILSAFLLSKDGDRRLINRPSTMHSALNLKVVLVPFSVCWGKEHLIQWWGDVAEYYKNYPAELVFEILNEPKMAGHPDGEEAVTMQWYGDCIQTIRTSNPTRLLAVGGPHYNGVEFLTKYVTPEYSPISSKTERALPTTPISGACFTVITRGALRTEP